MASIQTITASQLEYLQDNYEYVTVDLGRRKVYAYVLEDISQVGELNDMDIRMSHIERRPWADLWSDKGWLWKGLLTPSFFDDDRYRTLSTYEDVERFAKEYLRDCTESTEYDIDRLSEITVILSDMVEKSAELKKGQYMCFDSLNNDFETYNTYDVYHIDTDSHVHRLAVIVDEVEDEDQDEEEF